MQQNQSQDPKENSIEQAKMELSSFKLPKPLVYALGGLLIGIGAAGDSGESDMMISDPAAQTISIDPEKKFQALSDADLIRTEVDFVTAEVILDSINPLKSVWEREMAETSLTLSDPGAVQSLKIARQLLEETGLDSPPWQKKALQRFILARELNIEFPSRLPDKVIDELLANRVNPQVDDRPLAVVVYPKGDYNGAFYLSKNIFAEMSEAGYRVMYYEVESDTEFASKLLEASGIGTDQEQKASLLVFGGHGTQTSLSFERDSNPQEGNHGEIDFSDEEFFKQKGLAGVLKEGGQIVLDSCSNGEGRADADNMANFIRKVFAHAKERGIWSATESYGPLEFHFNESGELERVDFPVPGYQAFIDQEDRLVIVGNTA